MQTAQTSPVISGTEIADRVLSDLDFTVKMDGMLGHCIIVDRKRGVVSLSPELTTTEYLAYVLLVVWRIMSGRTVTDRFEEWPSI